MGSDFDELRNTDADLNVSVRELSSMVTKETAKFDSLSLYIEVCLFL